MICAACGHENPKTNRFCGGCGAPLREPAPRVAEEHGPTRIARNEGLEVELRARVQEAKASERRLLDVLEGVQLVAVSTALDGRIRFCNRYLCELSGWTREELLGRVWAETFNDQSTIVEQLAAGKVADHEEAPLRTRSGEIREISWSTTPDRDADGKITGATGIGQDVTERNRAAADLRRLAQQQAALRRVATCVASEINSSSVFDIVAEEVACLLGGRSANVVRFEPDANAGTMVGGWTRGFRSLPAGSRALTQGRAFLLFTSHRAMRDAAARLDEPAVPAPRPGRCPARDARRSVPRDAECRAARHRLVLGRRRRARRCAVARRDRQAAVRAAHRSAGRRAHARARRGERGSVPDRAAAGRRARAQAGLRPPDPPPRRPRHRRDPRRRVVTKAYGRVFLDTLPAGLPRTSALEQVKRWWATAAAAC